MYRTSDAYKNAVYAPTRTTKARVTFDISDITAAEDVSSIASTGQAVISDKGQLINKKREQSYNIATWEKDRFKLDGSFSFPDDTAGNNGEMGFVSDILSDSDGTFSVFPVLTFQFNKTHSSMGLTITFDVPNSEYAEDFTVTAYDRNDVVIDTVDVIGNTEVQAVPIGQLYQYKKVEIVIKKWCKPYHRARVVEVDFGVVRVYQDNNLIKLSLIEELDLTSSKLPSPEFKFIVDNVNREFNILNPKGFYKFLQQRQQVIAELGVETGGTYEYTPLGNYLLWEWASDEGSLTASFTARTNLDLMSGFDYENLISKADYNLYQMAVDIFALCGITNYQIDSALQHIQTSALIKKMSCKDVLRMIALAGCANIYITRDNMIVLKVSPVSIGGPADTIDMDNMYKEPQIVLDKAVKSVQVTYYTDIDTKQIVTINNGDISMGDVLKLENNTLINTLEQAANVANWLLLQKSYRAIYSMNWRGNPAHELSDIVAIETSYGDSKKAFVTKTSIEYQGYLRTKTEARGPTEIVN